MAVVRGHAGVAMQLRERTDLAISPIISGQTDVLRKEAVAQVIAELFEHADGGNTTAMRLLGCSVSQGFSTEREDSVLAFRCFLSSAQKGDVIAQYNLGVCYSTGRGVRQDQVKATKWFRAAADAGDTESMRVMAVRMSEGRGCQTDLEAATTTFLRAAEAGDPTAEFNLGVRYASGHGIPRPAPAAKAFYLGGGQADVAGQGAARDAARELWENMLDCEEVLDPTQARIAAEWYKRAASRGHRKAMYNLAQLMATGRGVPLSHDGASDLLREAAHKGYPRAQYALSLQLSREAAALVDGRVGGASSTCPPRHLNISHQEAPGDRPLMPLKHAEARHPEADGGDHSVGTRNFGHGATVSAASIALDDAPSERVARALEAESMRWLQAAADAGYGKVCVYRWIRVCTLLWVAVGVWRCRCVVSLACSRKRALFSRVVAHVTSTIFIAQYVLQALYLLHNMY